MAINDIINDFAAAIAAARERFKEVERRIGEIGFEKRKISRLAPHTDDIVEALRRGIGKATESFETRLRWFINADNLSGGRAENIENASLQLLMLPKGPPDQSRTTGAFPPSGLAEQQAEADVAAVTYFLRDRIAAEIPALVDKLYPAAKKNKTREEREAAMQELDTELTALQIEREKLRDHINLAAQAAYQKPDTQ